MGFQDRDYVKNRNKEDLKDAQNNLKKLSFFKERKKRPVLNSIAIWCGILAITFLIIRETLIITHKTEFDKKYPWLINMHQIFIVI